MPQLRQYPTDQELKAVLDAHSKGKLGEYLEAAAAKRDLSEENCMTQNTKNDEDQWSGSPNIVYRNPNDDPIRLACEEASKQLRPEGVPMFHPKKD
jgi:hypothetical protein